MESLRFSCLIQRIWCLNFSNLSSFIKEICQQENIYLFIYFLLQWEYLFPLETFQWENINLFIILFWKQLEDFICKTKFCSIPTFAPCHLFNTCHMSNVCRTYHLLIPNFVELGSHIFFLKTNLVIIYFTKKFDVYNSLWDFVQGA